MPRDPPERLTLVVQYLHERGDAARRGVAAFVDLVPHKSVDVKHSILGEPVMMNRFRQPREVLIIRDVDVRGAHERADPLIRCTHDHLERESLGMTPLFRFLPPNQSAHFDRCHNKHRIQITVR